MGEENKNYKNFSNFIRLEFQEDNYIALIRQDDLPKLDDAVAFFCSSVKDGGLATRFEPDKDPMGIRQGFLLYGDSIEDITQGYAQAIDKTRTKFGFDIPYSFNGMTSEGKITVPNPLDKNTFVDDGNWNFDQPGHSW